MCQATKETLVCSISVYMDSIVLAEITFFADLFCAKILYKSQVAPSSNSGNTTAE